MARVVLEDYIGKKFRELLVLRFSHRDKKSVIYFIAKCDCGNEKPIIVHRLGKDKSCGCKRKAKKLVNRRAAYEEKLRNLRGY